MRINGRMTLIILTILLVGSLYLGTSSVNKVAGAATLSDDVRAGETYYYKINKFPSFQELLELSGATDQFNATHYVEITGGIQGSEIYVKVIDTNVESGSFWDGTNLVSGSLPTVDLSVGMITGSAIAVKVAVGDDIFDTALPAGLGLPIPMIFGSATQFNISNFREDIMPIPLILNNNWDLHELIFNQIANSENVTGISVLSDDAQFKVSADKTPLSDEGDIVLDGFFSYRKSDGLASQLNFQITNTTSSEILFDFDISLNSEEYRPIVLEAGDHFEFTIKDAGLTASTNQGQKTADFIADLNRNMTDQIGNVLLEFDVVSVDGMYYSAAGSVLLDNGSRVDFPTGEDDFTDLWFVGFGRFGPGMPITTDDPANASQTIWAGNSQIPVTTRRRAMVGPIISDDYRIYEAWDTTMAYFVDSANVQLLKILTLLEELESNVEFASSLTSDPVVKFNYSSASDAAGYSNEFSLNVDLFVWMNETYVNTFSSYNATSNTWENVTEVNEYYSNTTVIGDFAMGMSYNNTYAGAVFNSFKISAAVDITIVGYNSTWSDTTKINIASFVFEIAGVFNPINPPPEDTGTSTTEVPSSETEPQLPLPGFELYLAIFSIIGFAIITRRRRQL